MLRNSLFEAVKATARCVGESSKNQENQVMSAQNTVKVSKDKKDKPKGAQPASNLLCADCERVRKTKKIKSW